MFGLAVDKSSSATILRQLTEQLRRMVLEGRLAGGTRLPPTRSLAGELGIARNTIVQVYEQLTAEGYLESRTGSGTYVAELAGYRPVSPSPGVPQGAVSPKRRPEAAMVRFNAGNPDTALFPVTQWARLLKEACLGGQASLFEYGPPAGEWALRSAIAEYLYRSKGIACQPESVLIVPGAARGVEVLARVLAEGQPAAVEDPSMDFVQHILRMCGCIVVPVPVDRAGMMTDRLPEEAKLIYVVPSHQFPTGAVLPIGRRLRLLDHARRTGALIIEDDYDSEYRYEGGPIQSLRHLDPERVIYLGTFSKILSPALRMGYLIVPRGLRNRLEIAMERLNLRTPAVEQMALAAFIGEKLLDRHVFRMKKTYEKKRAHLIAALQEAFGDDVSVTGENAGMHVLAAFRGGEFTAEDFAVFVGQGVEVDWAEEYAIVKGRFANQLVLGYGSLSTDRIDEGVRRLKLAIDVIRRNRTEHDSAGGAGR